MIRAGITGGTGYTAGELIRLLINHPDVEIVFLHSPNHAGQYATDVHAGLFGECHIKFTAELPLDSIDILFCCTYLEEIPLSSENHLIPERLKIIDLTPGHRISSEIPGFIYGLPELNRRAICHSKQVTNPGSLATCVELGLLPLAKHLMLMGDITVNAIIGSTAAGTELSDASPFSWRDHNLSIYQPFRHPDIHEIKQSLRQLQNSFQSAIDIIPYSGSFTRGIFATLLVKTKTELEELTQLYKDYYAEDSFTYLIEKNIHLKQVVNTNKCLIQLEKQGDKLLIVSCIDNLLKGASGQAVHNMNLLFGLEETVGLRLKSSAF